jgi:cobalt/nickel transport system ATP-binding protein
MRINHGESVGIIGANGAGKSTLLELIVGLILPSNGEIDVGGISVTKKTLPLIRRHVGYTFQNPDNQLFMNTVYEDIAFGPRQFLIDEGEIEKKVSRALEVMDISHLKDRPPYRLSGGEKRSAAIATVLSLEPDILLMDEPSSDLDPRARRKLISLIKGFSHTKLVTSHDLDLVLELCSRIIVLEKGRVVFDGKPLDALSDEKSLLGWGLEKPLSMQGCSVCNMQSRKTG